MKIAEIKVQILGVLLGTISSTLMQIE